LGYYELAKNDLDFAVGGFWEELKFHNLHSIIFVLKSSLKYALGYLEDMNDQKNIVLWEYHAGYDTSKEIIIASRNLSGKDVLIVDRSFSGITLKELADRVKKMGGRPTTLSLFPKSLSAIKNSDCFIYLDTLIHKKDLKLSQDWAEQLFIDVLKK
jgi:hypothetical protein